MAAPEEGKIEKEHEVIGNGQEEQQMQNHNFGRGGRGRSRFGPPARGREDNRGMRGDENQMMDPIEGQEQDFGQGGIRPLMGQNYQGGGGGRGGRGPSRFRGGGGGGQNMGGGGYQSREDRMARSQDDRLNERLASLMGPTHDLPPAEVSEKKFSGRCRLYIGNLTNDATEEELQEMFKPYGETSELFVNKEKNFAFIRLDYRANAEKAKRELDGSLRKGRPLKVRFAPHSAAIKVKNLTPWVTNELLEKAFGVFGELERAVIIVDERGKPTGEGIIEYSRRPGAQLALRRCSEGCFFLTASLRPVVLEPFEQSDEIDGYPEKNIPKKTPDYYKAREAGPRFASPGSFEHEYGTRWKQLYELYKQKEEALKRELKMEEEKLEAQMEYARYEHETEMLREQLRQRELDRERQKREWEMKERQAEESRLAGEERMRRQQEEMSLRMHHQEEELRRRQQENSLFMQEPRTRIRPEKRLDRTWRQPKKFKGMQPVRGKLQESRKAKEVLMMIKKGRRHPNETTRCLKMVVDTNMHNLTDKESSATNLRGKLKDNSSRFEITDKSKKLEEKINNDDRCRQGNKVSCSQPSKREPIRGTTQRQPPKKVLKLRIFLEKKREEKELKKLQREKLVKDMLKKKFEDTVVHTEENELGICGDHTDKNIEEKIFSNGECSQGNEAHQLTSLLDQQEQALRQTPADYDSPNVEGTLREYETVAGINDFAGEAAGNIPPDPKAFMDQYDRAGGRYEGARGGDMREDIGAAGGGRNMSGNRGRWGQAERRAEDYPSKRRRY